MPGIHTSLFSMGKFIRDGWEFRFGECGSQLFGITPAGIRIDLVLGQDNLIYLPHELRSGADTARLPPVPGAGHKAMLVRRTMPGADAHFMHDLLLHCHRDKQVKTIEHTRGYKPASLPNHQCNSCAEANARSCLLYTSPSPRDQRGSRMPSSA